MTVEWNHFEFVPFRFRYKFNSITSNYIINKFLIKSDKPKWQTTASTFAVWVRMAMEQPRSEERRELYTFLTDCFMDADADRDGFVNKEEFDFLCEKAAALPRRFGLAPSWRDLYSPVEARQAGRRELFQKVDSSKRGTIGMDDWIQYSFKHIEEK